MEYCSRKPCARQPLVGFPRPLGSTGGHRVVPCVSGRQLTCGGTGCDAAPASRFVCTLHTLQCTLALQDHRFRKTGGGPKNVELSGHPPRATTALSTSSPSLPAASQHSRAAAQPHSAAEALSQQ